MPKKRGGASKAKGSRGASPSRKTPPRDSRGRFVSPKKKRARSAPKVSIPTRRSSPPESARFARKVRETERAISKVKPPRGHVVEVGKTRFVTPTKAGLKAVERSLSKARVPKGKKAIYTADVVVRYRDPKTGRFASRELTGLTLPRDRDVIKRKGETREEARNRMIATKVMGAVMTLKGIVYGEYSDRRARRLQGSRESVQKELRAMKKGRQIKFRVKVKRVIT